MSERPPRPLASLRTRHRPPPRAVASLPVVRPFNLPLRFSPYGGEASAFVDAGAHTAWTATLSADASPWLAFSGPASGTGPGLVTLKAPPNTTGAHTAELTVRLDGVAEPLVWPAIQASAASLAALNTSVLTVPFPTTPRVMELGIAGKFIGTEIQKVPIIIRPLVLLIAEIIVVVLGILAIVLRTLATALVPTFYEPKTWLPAPPSPPGFPPIAPFIDLAPVTTIVIGEETYLLALSIAEESAE